MVKKLIPLLLMLLVTVSIVACTPSEEPEVPELPVTLKNADVEYAIISADDATAGAKEGVNKLYLHLRSIGQSLTPDTDYVRDEADADNDKFEILIGKTNRPESAAAEAAIPTYLDYSIKVEGNKIAIAANTDEQLVAAVDYFISQLSVTEELALTYIGAHNYVSAYDAYKYKNLAVGGVAISEYKIIIPASASAADISFSENLQNKIAVETGIVLDIKTDAEAVGANEILVGKTNRQASSEFTSGALVLKGKSYSLKTAAGLLVFSAGSSSGYNAMIEKMDELIVGDTLAADINETFISSAKGLEDGANIMVVGNSFLYYGECVHKGGSFGSVDNAYLSKLCNSIADDVTVINCTIGGAGLKSLYNKMLEKHPNYYGNSSGKKMDSFYDQDFVILQQEGSNASSTMEYAQKIISIFPPETEFFFFVHDHNVRREHTNVLNAAKELRDEYGVVYIPTGHMTYDVWRGATKVPGSSIKYNKNTFVVDWSDSHHPNYLTGYFSTIMIYSAITGESCVGLDWSFVSRDDKKYYTAGTSNFVSVLDSEADMLALQQIADDYLAKYNP